MSKFAYGFTGYRDHLRFWALDWTLTSGVLSCSSYPLTTTTSPHPPHLCGTLGTYTLEAELYPRLALFFLVLLCPCHCSNHPSLLQIVILLELVSLSSVRPPNSSVPMPHCVLSLMNHTVSEFSYVRFVDYRAREMAEDWSMCSTYTNPQFNPNHPMIFIYYLKIAECV